MRRRDRSYNCSVLCLIKLFVVCQASKQRRKVNPGKNDYATAIAYSYYDLRVDYFSCPIANRHCVIIVTIPIDVKTTADINEQHKYRYRYSI